MTPDKVFSRNNAVPHDTEDKVWWLQHGENLESQFVDLCNRRLGVVAEINPQKVSDPTLPDVIVDGLLSDLKAQNTPFFTAGRYHLDPRFTVTFNRKDYERYRRLYPSIVIYFWVDWRQTNWRGVSVEYLGGIYRTEFKELASMIEGGAPEHFYRNRVADTLGNAKSSFLLDVRSFSRLFSTDSFADSNSQSE